MSPYCSEYSAVHGGPLEPSQPESSSRPERPFGPVPHRSRMEPYRTIKIHSTTLSFSLADQVTTSWDIGMPQQRSESVK